MSGRLDRKIAVVTGSGSGIGKATALRFPYQPFIDGKHVDALSGATFDALSPIDGAVLAKVARCDQADPKTTWSAAATRA